MREYYSDDRVRLYHGDNREFAAESFDLLLTDPPYGIGKKWQGGVSVRNKHGWAGADKQKGVRNKWDDQPPATADLNRFIDMCKLSIVWGGNYFELPVSRCWLVWNKPERGFTLAECELAWTNADNVARVCDCKRRDDSFHPTQKPQKLMDWCLGLTWAKGSGSVFDPYCGSGTTLMAAKLHGMKAVGIEANERYCEYAADRLSQGVLF